MLRWFESTSSHQNEIPSRSISFLFYINIVTSCAGGFEQPVSDALRPVGQKHPLRGVFRARLGGSTSSHQNEILSRSISFLFYINIITSCVGGFEQPVSDALRPVGQKHPCGVFLWRGLAGSPAPTKTRYFSGCISFFKQKISLF